nr:glycosyltransferase family 2 protein [Aeromicrobium duanguangcaii]
MVVVGFNSERFVPRLAEAWRDATHLAQLVFVDNAPIPTTIEAVSTQAWPVEPLTVAVPTNPGFGGGVNRGVAALVEASPYVVVANPDLLVREEHILAVIAELEGDERRAVGGVQLVTSDGRRVSSARAFPTVGSLAARRVEDIDLSARSREVDWICGAFMVWRREWFDRVGGFDGRFFLYYEDVDICRAVRAAGGISWAVSGFQVIHDQGHGEETSEALRAQSRAAKVIYARKWLGAAGVAAARWGNAMERLRAVARRILR